MAKDEPRELAEKLAKILIEHDANSLLIPVEVNGESITIIVKYDSQLTLNEIDDYVIDSGGIYRPDLKMLG